MKKLLILSMVTFGVFLFGILSMPFAGNKVIVDPGSGLTKTYRVPLAFVSGDTVKSFVVDANALTHTIILEMPSFSGAVVTGTLSVENADGNEIYTNGGMVENDTHVMFAERPLVSSNTVKVTLSTDPSSNGTAYVSMYLKGE